jgi:hypothetical protein
MELSSTHIPNLFWYNIYQQMTRQKLILHLIRNVIYYNNCTFFSAEEQIM